MVAPKSKNKPMSSRAGLAIGPILFIIAILAILAAAVASSSGHFTTTGSESNKTKSATLVQIGENLKTGMERITIENAISSGSVDVNVSNTTLPNHLFSPIGGGIAPPPIGMAASPLHDRWYFPQGKPAGFGTGTANTVFAVLPVPRGVCAEVNNRSMGVAAVPPKVALGDFESNIVTTGASWPTASSTWTEGATGTATDGPTLAGVIMGCVWNDDETAAVAANCSSISSEGVGIVCTDGPTSPFFFYQVLTIQ
jgi:hypothetical protein